MPTFNSQITRSEASALMPEDASREILQTVAEGSTALRLARRLPNMARGVRRLPILSVLPQAYFVGEAGRSPQTFSEVKQSTEGNWDNKYIYAEEIACIVPIPESVLDDVDYDIWAELRPQIVAAFGAKIDSAIFFGTHDVDVPANWPDGLLIGMPAHHIIADTFGDDLFDAIMGDGGVLAQVEEDGFMVNGHVAALSMRSKLRGLRNSQGTPIFISDMHSQTPYSLDGNRLEFPVNGAFNPLAALLLSGDWNQLVYSIRQDITYKVLTEGVITDNSTPRVILHNLAQDDMVALRVTFRMGWQLPNPVNRVQTDDTKRYPFAALAPTGS